MKIKKLFCSVLLVMFLTACLPLFVGCNSSRPNIGGDDANSSQTLSPTDTSQTNEDLLADDDGNDLNSVNNSSELYLITVGDGIKISSSSLSKIDENTFSISKNSSFKISIELAEIISTANRTYYYDQTKNKIYNGIYLNETFYDISLLSDEFLIKENTQIRLSEDNFSLAGLMICFDNSPSYKKFNQISQNFRNSLVKTENGKINFDCIKQNYNDSIYFIDLSGGSNIKHSLTKNDSAINLKIEAFSNAYETSLMFVYTNSASSIVLSSNFLSHKFSTKDNQETDTYNLIGGKTLCIEFAKYRLTN